MLSIGLMGMHQERYYTELSSQEYYTSGGEPEGRWSGRGAEQLNLAGASLDAKQLGLLLQGFTPDGQRRLVRNAGGDSRRAGFDLTFNAPKSVSVLFALAAPEHRKQITQAQDAAVRAALEYVEAAAGCIRIGRNGVDSMQAGFVAALFEHSTARPVPGHEIPDMHLHTHALPRSLRRISTAQRSVPKSGLPRSRL